MNHHDKIIGLSIWLGISSMLPAFADTATDFLLQKGYDQLRRKEYSNAATTFSQAVRNNPQDLQARRYLAAALTRSGQSKAAAQQLQMITQNDPGKAYDQAALGEAYLLWGKTKLAVTSYNEALKLDPSLDSARLGLAQSLLALNQTTKAKQVCLEGLRITASSSLRLQFKDVLGRIKQLESGPNAESTLKPG